jgi:hypothetical protein
MLLALCPALKHWATFRRAYGTQIVFSRLFLRRETRLGTVSPVGTTDGSPVVQCRAEDCTDVRQRTTLNTYLFAKSFPPAPLFKHSSALQNAWTRACTLCSRAQKSLERGFGGRTFSSERFSPQGNLMHQNDISLSHFRAGRCAFPLAFRPLPRYNRLRA